MTQPTAPPTEQIFGMAKKMDLELEKLPLHTLNMLRTMCEHRKIELDNQANEAQVKAQQAAYDDALRQHAKAQVLREEDERNRAEKQLARAKDAATGGLALVDATGAPYQPQDATPAQPEAALVS